MNEFTTYGKLTNILHPFHSWLADWKSGSSGVHIVCEQSLCKLWRQTVHPYDVHFG